VLRDPLIADATREIIATPGKSRPQIQKEIDRFGLFELGTHVTRTDWHSRGLALGVHVCLHVCLVSPSQEELGHQAPCLSVCQPIDGSRGYQEVSVFYQ